MKIFDDSCTSTIEVFDNYDGTWLYWGDKSLDNQLSEYLKNDIKKFGRYFLNNLPSYSECFLNGYLSKEIININNRLLYQDVFILNRIWNSEWNEYEYDEIKKAINDTNVSKTIIINNI